MVVSGAILALCFAPFHWWPLAAISISSLYLSLSGAQSLKQSAWRGFFFGYGFFIAGTYWIAFSLLVEADKFAWLVPFSVLGLSAVMALYIASLGGVFYRLKCSHHLANMCLFTVLWMGLEWLRSLGMFGFPWNLVGYISAASLALAQAASTMGVYGLGVVMILAALVPASLLIHKHTGLWHAALMAAILLGLWVLGVHQIPAHQSDGSTMLRVVQPNIPQAMKWSPQGQHEARSRLQSLSQLTTEGKAPDIVVWPETALPRVVSGVEDWANILRYFVPRGAALITGALREEAHRGAWYNSVLAITAYGTQMRFYDKHQLVPFGEFVPLSDVLPLEKITQGNGSFTRGGGPMTMQSHPVPPFSPLICYEAVFPQFTVGETRPEWLLNVTNDAWFGNSPGPYQHFEMVRFRAIEQRLPLVRAANTGISAVIDPYGRIIKKIDLNDTGIIDVPLPNAGAVPIYSQVGNGVFFIVMGLILAGYFWLRNKAQ